MTSIHQDIINFGKHKGKSVSVVLRDRNYCKWLLDQPWFKDSHTYLYNRIVKYKPQSYFIPKDRGSSEINSILKDRGSTQSDFMDSYVFFHLLPLDKVEIDLSPCDKTCYEFYLEMIEEIKRRIYERMENDEDNQYDIKAPTRWLARFEKQYLIPREDFKEFLTAYELPNIPTIIEHVKKAGGIEYKGARSFIIAKNNSKIQEKWWEDILRSRYGENISPQYLYKKCLFDFINIKTKTMYEVKLGIKDFNQDQFVKYQSVLGEFDIVYLVDRDCVINVSKKIVFTTDENKYRKYISGIPTKKKPNFMDQMLLEFKLVWCDGVKQCLYESDHFSLA